jgi:hypothetical protein
MADMKLLKASLLSIWIATSVTGCEDLAGELFGKDDDEETQVIDENPDQNNDDEEPVLQSLSGKTADGYLVNARVCADLNNNSVCDSDEPTATSTAGGEYTVNDIPEGVDLSQVRIIVEVIANETIDEDHPNETVEKAYTLTSPPGKPEFVSPITTIVDAVLQNDEDLSLEEAEDQIKEDLGLDDDSEISLFDDYVEGADTDDEDNADEFEKLHVVAQVVTEVIADSLDTATTEDSTLTSDDAFSDTLNAVVANVEDNLEELVEVIDEVIAAAEEAGVDNPVDIAEEVLSSDEVEFIVEETVLDAEEIIDVIEEIEDEKSATDTNVETLLTQNEGFFFVDSDDEQYWDGEKCKVDFEFSYNQFKIVENIGQMAFWRFNPETEMFEQEQDEEENDFQFYGLTDAGWTMQEEGVPQVDSFSDDGQTLTVSFPGQGSRTILATQIDLTDKSLSEIDRVDEAWAMQMMEAQTFPADSAMYLLTMEQLDSAYMVPVFQCEQEDAAGNKVEENCNTLWRTQIPGQDPSTGVGIVDDYRASTFEQIINTEWDGDFSSLVMFHAPFSHDMELALIQGAEGEDNKALLIWRDWSCFEHDQEGKEEDDDAECMHIHVEKELDWKIEEISGQQLLHIDLPEFEDEDEFNGVFLTVVDEYVRVGMFIESGQVWREEHALNKTAMDAVTAGFMAPEGKMELVPEACGIFEDDKDDDGTGDDGDKDPTDGDGDGSDDEDKPQGPPPALVSDANNTAALLEKVYVMEHMDTETGESETIVLQFMTEQKIKVLGVETEYEMDSAGNEFMEKDEFVEMGTWVIDADQKLLFTFEEEYEADDGTIETEVNWKLFKVDGDLGTSLTFIDETPDDDDMGDTLMFNQINAWQLASSLIMERVEEDGTECKLELTFTEGQEQNTGSVNATSCPNMVEDNMSEFNFTWQIGDFGQVIMTVDIDDDVENNTVEIFQNADGQIYLFIEGDETEELDDGTMETFHFVSIETWTQVFPE